MVNPWQVSNKLIKNGEPCFKGKKHNLRMIFHSQSDINKSSNGSNSSEVIYQCVTCKKFLKEKTVHDICKFDKNGHDDFHNP